MRLISKYLAAGALLGAVTILHADTTPASGVSGTPTASVAVQLSVPEMQASAETFLRQVQEHYRAVLRLEEKIRLAKDIIKLTCINDKLVQIKAQMNIVDMSNRQLQDAFAKKSDERHSSYSQLERAASAVHTLHEESNACVGEPELFKAESDVEVTHPDFPDDPVGDNPWDPVGATDVEPPGYASLFL